MRLVCIIREVIYMITRKLHPIFFLFAMRQILYMKIDRRD